MKPLIQTNPYLKDKEYRETSNARSARTSCGVEGIKVEAFSKGQIHIDSTNTHKVFEKIKLRLKS
jgi:hypothetical protein